MELEALLGSENVVRTAGGMRCNVTGVCSDSRLVGPGCLFIAVKGTQADGHDYIQKAADAGAAAIVCQVWPDTLPESVACVQVEDSESAVGRIATTFYGDPSSKLKLVGVTGTNGKTSVATLLYDLFRALGHKCGLCSTVCDYIDGMPVPTEHTTPDPVTLNCLLGQMADKGCEYAFMEVSSHAAAQHRIAGLHFAGGVFTNLTRDHMDYHKTVENYRDAKKSFFDILGEDAFAVTNADDKNGLFMVQNCRANVRTYSTRAAADFKAKVLEESFEGMLLEMDGHEDGVAFTGRFNVSNLLAVYGAAICLGVNGEKALTVMSALRPVTGRFETIRSGNGVTAIVDYAHTPDALTNVLATVNEILKHKGRVITVCGAGGNRDKGKRPMMAREAAKGSDRVILTSDNPRFEEPQAIIDDMLAGLDKEDMKRVLAIADRKEAIRTACLTAEPGDVILVAGKGHEDYQEVRGVKRHFDDHEIIKEAFGIN